MAAVTHALPAANLAIALRVVARLLAYPDAALRRDLPDVRAALRADGALSAARKHEIEALIGTLEEQDAIASEGAFVDLFDRGRATSLHLFEHVHGDSRERGPAMADLEQTYAAAGLLLAPGELPDYLPVIVEFVSTQTTATARAFLAEMAHLLDAIRMALHRRESPYACLLAALLDLAGEPADAALEPSPLADATIDESNDLDASWSEPPAFGGCPAASGTTAAAPQTINFVARSSSGKQLGIPTAGSAPTGVTP